MQVSSQAMTNPPNPMQKGVVDVDIPLEPNRGREGERAQGKRGKSKAPFMNVLEPRVATLEITLYAVQNIFKGLEERVDGLKGEYVEFTVATKALIQNQVNTLRGEFRSFHDELLKLRNFVQEELCVIRVEVEEVHSY